MADLIELAELSDIARETLIAARKTDDSVLIVASDQQGDFVLAGQRPLEGPSYATVVRDLCDAGYFRTTNDEYFQLTGKGIEAADALQDLTTIDALEGIRLRKTVLDDLYRFHLQKGFQAELTLQVQAERVGVSSAEVRRVWEYLLRIGAITMRDLYGLNALAQISIYGIQICEAAHRAALAARENETTTIMANQVIIAGRDAHHIQHGTTNIQQEGLDLEAVTRLIEEIRAFVENKIADATQRNEALSDLQDIEAAAKDRTPGCLGRAKEALGRMCNRLRSPAYDLAVMFELFNKMAQELARYLRLA